jgi:hypothetical protein
MKRPSAKTLATVVLLPVLAQLIHESMHLLTLFATGGQVHQVVIFEALQIIPSVQRVEPTGAVYMMATTPGSDAGRALTWLAGSGSTFLLSLAAIPIWLKRRTLPWLVVIFWGLDCITYILLPSLGLKRWLFTGPPFSEIIAGLEYFGIGQGFVSLLLLAWAAGMAALYRYAKKNPAPQR